MFEVINDKVHRQECMYDVTIRIDLECIVEQLTTGSKAQDEIEYDIGVAVVKAIKQHLNKKY